jgi:hypothetical protein
MAAQQPQNAALLRTPPFDAQNNWSRAWALYFMGTTSHVTGALTGGQLLAGNDAADIRLATASEISAQVLAAIQSTGTFTPVLAFGGASVGITYVTQAGDYCKVGNLVTVRLNVLLSSKGSSTGAATITGLPFTANAGGARFGAALGLVAGMTVVPFLTMNGGSTFLDVRDSTTGSPLADTAFTNTSQIEMSISYFV